MKYFLFAMVLVIGIGCAPLAGPKNFYYKKDGAHYRKATMYYRPEHGRKKIAQIDVWKDNRLHSSKIFYIHWPNGEWKFVSKEGFYIYKNGEYLLNKDSVKVPDHIIYTHFDKDHEEIIEVYKNGKRIPYTLGHYDGYTVHKYTVKNPGVYSWKDGKEFFLREFTKDEWENHLKMNEYLNRNNKKNEKAE